MIKIRNPRDFWSGVMFVAFGGAGIWLARAFPYGTAARMGPAYFPTLVGGLLAAFGLFGVVALAGTPYDDFGKMFNHPASAGGRGGSSGCGGGGCLRRSACL